VAVGDSARRLNELHESLAVRPGPVGGPAMKLLLYVVAAILLTAPLWFLLRPHLTASARTDIEHVVHAISSAVSGSAGRPAKTRIQNVVRKYAVHNAGREVCNATGGLFR
jgi:hypothetical protein